MALYIRMALYAVSMFVAGMGWASFDDNAGTLTVNIDDLAVILGGFVTFIGTFLAGRLAKKNGGAT